MVIEMAQHCHKKLFQIVLSDSSNTLSSASGHSYEKLEEVLKTSSLKFRGMEGHAKLRDHVGVELFGQLLLLRFP